MGLLRELVEDTGMSTEHLIVGTQLWQYLLNRWRISYEKLSVYSIHLFLKLTLSKNKGAHASSIFVFANGLIRRIGPFANANIAFHMQKTVFCDSVTCYWIAKWAWDSLLGKGVSRASLPNTEQHQYAGMFRDLNAVAKHSQYTTYFK